MVVSHTFVGTIGSDRISKLVGSRLPHDEIAGVLRLGANHRSQEWAEAALRELGVQVGLEAAEDSGASGAVQFGYEYINDEFRIQTYSGESPGA